MNEDYLVLSKYMIFCWRNEKNKGNGKINACGIKSIWNLQVGKKIK